MLLTLYVTVNLTLLWRYFPFAWAERDWVLWRAIFPALNEGKLYELDLLLPYIWSPVAAPIMGAVGAMGVLGVWVSVVAHVGTVLLLRDRLLIFLTLVAWPFWIDAMAGNVMTFVVVAGAFAIRGSRAGAIAYFVIFMLVPRPLMLPLGGWLAWQMPAIRWPVIALGAVHGALVIVSGYAVPWVEAMLAHAATPPTEVTPVGWFGWWWYAIAVPIAAWLTYRRRFGWASLVMTSYLVLNYMLTLLWEWSGQRSLHSRGIGAADRHALCDATLPCHPS